MFRIVPRNLNSGFTRGGEKTALFYPGVRRENNTVLTPGGRGRITQF